MRISPIQIPYDEGGNLSGAYIETVRILEPHFDVVGFMDHDVEIYTRDWYTRLKNAILKHPDAGLWTCRVNLQHDGQRTQSLKIRDDFTTKHKLELEASRRALHGGQTTVIGSTPPELISGCWFFVHTQRFLKFCTDIPPGFYGVDNLIHRKLDRAGHPAVVLEDVLVWHRYSNIEPRPDRKHLIRLPVK